MEPWKKDLIKTCFRNFFSELIGTAILVFLGCLSVCKGLGQPGDQTGVILAFAFGVFIAVQAVCHNSGGHVNPAVTVLSLFFKKLSFYMAAVYVVGQLLGGIVGFGLLKAITPPNLLHAGGSEKYGVCTTVPHQALTVFQALFAEFLFSFILFFIICSAWDPRNVYHDSMTIKFGFVIYSLGYGGAIYTGCSMNPARSLGPAIWNQAWKDHWIYWMGPLAAAVLCGFIYTTFFSGPKAKSQGGSNKDELEMSSM